MKYYKTPELIFKAKKKELEKIPGIGTVRAEAIVKADVLSMAEKELDFIKKNNIEVICFDDNDYPVRLRQCTDAPLVLYAKSKVNLNAEKVISIVGIRRATDYASKMVKKILEDLVQSNHRPIIASGLAYGVDALAHRTALELGLETVAFLGHGLNLVYPAENKNLALQIKERGGLYTDFPSFASFERNNFIKRNRLIAGVSDATIVIESDTKGGALVTADLANSYHREVLAVPGKVGDKYSSGCNALIKENKAALITCGKDLEAILNWDVKPKIETQAKILFDLSPDEEKIMEFLKEGQKGFDEILRALVQKPANLSNVLLEMEFNGLIRQLPGKCYKIY